MPQAHEPEPRLTVKKGLITLAKPMTREQAERYGWQTMPKDLERAGFDCVVFRARMEINGWDGYRINYGKKC